MSILNLDVQLDILRHCLLADEQQAFVEERRGSQEFLGRDTDYRAGTLNAIENVFLQVILDVANGRPPELTFIRRKCWDNVRFDKDVGLVVKSNPAKVIIKFKSVASITKFSLILHVMSKIYTLIQTDCFSTKRDLYYQDKHLYKSQSTLDRIVEDICSLLQVPRDCLHVLATAKGCVAGDLQFVDSEGNFVDCSCNPSGVLIGPNVNGITAIRSQARFVLIIEKDATFQRLVKDESDSKSLRYIFITGKGYPDVYTRQLVHKLWHSLHIPLFTLVDADPHGIEIMCSYRYGSLNMCFDRLELATPAIRWLGLFPTDIERLHVDQSNLQSLSKCDMDRLRNLEGRAYFMQQPAFQRQLDVLKRLGAKAEIQCLDSLGPRFLAHSYIPSKISSGGWI